MTQNCWILPYVTEILQKFWLTQDKENKQILFLYLFVVSLIIFGS